ncbi:hypothetical protein [Nonomuraea roseola]|uniref:Serine/threonine protein kinase n=1 Tax=Nonomuraea roseola TaxID=46179 RepID=A0ABV5PRC2_9ACTN
MRLTKRVGPMAGAVALVGAVVLGVAPAHADSNTGPVKGPSCGAGYYLQESHAIRGKAGLVAGVVYLYYNRSTGNNCAITRRDRSFTTTRIAAGVQRKGDDKLSQDKGAYHSYAGPTYLYAKGQCVRFGGQLVGRFSTTTETAEWISDWGHCG